MEKIKVRNRGFMYVFNGLNDYEDYWKKHVTQKEEKDATNTVYVTLQGVRYHMDKQCFHIYVKAEEVLYKDMAGKRIPCSHCAKNFVPEETTVIYTTKSSSIFHRDARCHSIYHQLLHFEKEEAITRGYTPCKTCSKEN